LFCGFLQKQEKQQGVGRMKQHIDQVVAARLHAEDFRIEHVGNPGQRKPAAGLKRRKGAPDSFGGYAGTDKGILDYMGRVIVDDERKIVNPPVYGKYH
jgi:hypothetical protein